MAPPVATETNISATSSPPRKLQGKLASNPFYSPPPVADSNDGYEYAHYRPTFPKVDWEPLGDIVVSDRGHHADPEKKALLSAATKVVQLTPSIGTQLNGIDLRQLSNTQKDELALLVAERGVVVFEDQELNIHQQLELARYYGPLHKHATTGMPSDPALDEVHIVYSDGARRPDPTAFAQIELYHSDVTYEVQPPGLTSLKLITCPSLGGDTVWSSGYALYSSLSTYFQKYLESLTALHSAVAQAEGSRASGTHVRRQPIESVHPVVRVHPVTGYKSVFVNPGFTRRILGVPKAESDAILAFLFRELTQNATFQVRIKWSRNQVVFWDNRVTTHSATYDFWPERRHALRATPHGERPIGVADWERQTGRVARDRQKEVWKALGYDVDAEAEKERADGGVGKVRGYAD